MFRKITLFGVLLALAVLAAGAYVRLSGASTACPDWPGCYGGAFVPGAAVDTAKAWSVMFHRYLLGALTVVIVVLASMSWREQACRGAAVNASVVLLLLSGLQVALNFWTASLKGMPVAVTGQFLAGVAVAMLLYWLYLRTDPKVGPSEKPLGPGRFAAFALAVLMAEMVLGAWAGANGAAFACPDFPRCQDSFWPRADYSNAFVFWRGLFGDPLRALMSYDARVAIHWVHRVGALATFVVLAGLVFSATGGRHQPRVRRAGTLLSVLLLVQVALGITGVKQGMPVPVGIGHGLVAVLMAWSLLYIGFYSRRVSGERRERAETVVREAAAEAVAPIAPAEAEVYAEKEPETLYRRLKSQLQRTRAGLGSVLAGIPLGQKGIDEDILEHVEASLLMADVGVDATKRIIDDLTASLERHQLGDADALKGKLRDNLLGMLRPCNHPLTIDKAASPFVILVVGVNGVGKTTTIGKLAKRLQAQGHSVMLAAGDTFRAAAVEQLQTWGMRNNIPVIAQHTGADSASVIYDALQAAKARRIDVLIADTAGRLHTKSNLMEELRKIKRIIGRMDEKAPHEVLLVLDAGTGQNALSQAEQFDQAVELTGIALTKLDGTAKGGVIFALAQKFAIPIRYIGIGEGIDDLQDFDAEHFVDALFATD